MRPMTNLKSNADFKLPKAEQRAGFVSMYNAQVGGNFYEFVFMLTAGVLYPWVHNEKFPLETSDLKEFVKQHIKDTNRVRVVRSTLRRNNLTKSLEFRAPLFFVSSAPDSYLLPGIWEMQFRGAQAMSPDQRRDMVQSVKTVEDTVFAGGAVLSGAKIAELAKLSGRQREVIERSLLRVEAEVQGGSFTLWATWNINQKEAEYLNNVPFNQIKLPTLYPTLLDWASSCLGRDANLPDTICPVSAITSEVESLKRAAPIKPRVGLLNAVMDVNRHIYIIPEVDNALEYEQKLMEFGTQEDGSYTWRPAEAVEGLNHTMGESAPRKKLPANMPIYADWLNDKFVYSNSAGNLSVYDLSNTAPVGNYHVTALLNAAVDVSQKQDNSDYWWTTLTTAVGLASQFNQALLAERPQSHEVSTSEGRAFLESLSRKTFPHFRDMAHSAMQLFVTDQGDMSRLFVGPGGATVPRIYQLAELPQFNWMFRVCANALETLRANVEVMYTRYSVMNVLQQLAVLSLVVEYSPKRNEIAQADLAEREVYLNQGVDPEAPVESIPNIKNGLKYMPHQAKVQNHMRKGPKLAVLPVDAGGGKTIVILTNILLELKRKHCVRPIIACPAHLVGQYVKEVVFVTEGRLNLVPITNASFKAHGEEKIKQFVEKAPINTVFITDFNFLKGRRQRVAYGNKTLDVYRNAEFMRQFEFDLVSIDESHYLKNIKSARRDAAARFLMDIPMKRIASGTLVADTMLDLVSQIALMDPVIFGSEEHFKEEYAEKKRGDKVLSWRNGAEAEVRAKIAAHCVVAGARRKEWAALLPPKRERFLGVEMSKNQRLLYDSILKETMDLIEEAMSRDAEVRDLMDSEDDSKAEELEAKLRPYLARLERYMSAPEADPAAQLFLKDADDLTSPKVKKVYEICREHLESNTPGKILVFTQYTASAESVVANAPADLRPYFIHYTADAKAECKAEFENNPMKKIMVGVSSSMDTGLNLQFASRLIRMETVWTPGVLEQGNSRINRPELKKAEDRNMVYFDWLVINRSIDITKVSRLVSKIVSKAKFDEAGNASYEAIPNLPQVAMKLDNIRALNDFNEELLPYLQAYEAYQQVEEAEYANYKREQGDKIVPIDIPQEGVLEGSKLMSRVPYVPEMELYGVENLGLVRYDQFLRQDIEELEGDSDSASDDEDDEEENGEEQDGDSKDPRVLKKLARQEALRRERALIKGRAAHTDFGDGEVISVQHRFLKVRTASGTVIKTPKLQTYLITRATTNGIDMRNELLKQVGQIPLDAPIQVPVEDGAEDKKRKAKSRQGKEEVPVTPQGPEAEFDFTIINDFLGLMYRGDGTDGNMVSMLQNFGFRMSQPYNFVKIPGPKVMLRFVRALHDAGFVLTLDDSDELKRIYEALRVNRYAMNTFAFATKMKVSNFYRDQTKPSSDPNKLKIYPLIQDGTLFLAFPIRGQAGNMRASKVKVPGCAWAKNDGIELMHLFNTKTEAKDKVAELLQAGIVIPKKNLAQLGEQFKTIKLVVR